MCGICNYTFVPQVDVFENVINPTSIIKNKFGSHKMMSLFFWAAF